MKNLIILFSGLTFLFLSSFIQDNKKIHVITVKVREANSAKIAGAQVSAYDKSTMALINSVTTGADGNATFTFASFHDYIISVSKKGYLTKKIWINSQPVGKENKLSFRFENEVIVKIYNVLGKDVGPELIDEPAIKIAYFLPGNNAGVEGNSFDIDRNYEKQVRAKAQQLDPDARTAAFNALISGGSIPKPTASAGNKPVPVASKVPDRTTASNDKALEKTPQAKPVSAEDQYKEIIAKGDKAFDDKDYSNARLDYTEASQLKPSEKYPSDRLAEINKLLKEVDKTLNAIQSLGPGSRMEIINSQVIEQLQQEHDELTERSRQMEMLRKADARKMANLSTKYDTENPLTRLLDIIDSKPLQPATTAK